MSTMFGQRSLPPAEAVPPAVSDAITAWREAQARTGRAQAALGEHRRIGIAQARGKDIEQHAAAIEAGTAPPKSGAHEQRANQKLAQLEREVAAAELVEERCRQRMDERIGEHQAEIVSTAEARFSRARHDYLASLSEVERAIGELVAALAIKSWADNPTASYRLRGLRPVDRLMGEPPVSDVIDALRALLEPKRPQYMPAPFRAAPVEEPKGEPEPAAGSSAA
jgi:hypothetical protein